MAPWSNRLHGRLSSLVGRRRETVEAQQLLLAHRQLTLTGPAGCGKTRLALRVTESLAAYFAQRIYLVELAPVAQPVLVPKAVAGVVGVLDTTSTDLGATLASVLAAHRALLVLDNCEHVIHACATLVALLRDACPQLHLVVTSREALGISGEVEQVVPPLSYPLAYDAAAARVTPAELLWHESVQLFVERAWAINPDLAVDPQSLHAIGQVCHQLEGLPLAIELAAASTSAVSIRQIAKQLDAGLHTLRSGLRSEPPHHQSLIATLDWSYQLLSEQERACFRRLGVFAGGWSSEATAVVCDDLGAAPVIEGVLAALVRKSLIIVTAQAGELRYRALEPIRQYALMQLQLHDELARVRDRHLAYFEQFVRRIEPELIRTQQRVWRELVDRELGNLRAAMDWSIERVSANAGASHVTTALLLPARLERFWAARGQCGEGDERLTRALALPGAAMPEVVTARAAALNARAMLRCYLGLNDEVRVDLEQALALARAAGETLLELVTLRSLGTVAVLQGRLVEGEALLEAALALAGKLGPAADHSVAWSCLLLGSAAYLKGDDARAEAQYAAAVECLRSQGDLTMLALALRRMGVIALRHSRLQRAEILLRESLTHSIALSSPNGIVAAAAAVAGVLLARAQSAEAAHLLAAAAAVGAATGDQLVSLDRTMFDAHIDAARARLGPQAFEEIWSQGSAVAPEHAVAYIAELSVTRGDVPAPSGAPAAVAGADILTPRERQVAALVARGHSNREIANILHVEVKTVEAHITHIIGKLGASSRVQIATWALERGLALPQWPSPAAGKV